MINRYIIFSSIILFFSSGAFAQNKSDSEDDGDGKEETVKKKDGRKPGGTHLFIVISPDEYYKTLSMMAVEIGQKLAKKSSIIAVPFIESDAVIPKAEWDAVYKDKYKKGVKLFKKGKYPKAVKLLQSTVNGFKDLITKYGLTYKIRRRLSIAYYYLGGAQALDALTENAKGSFRSAYSLFPMYPQPKSVFKQEAIGKLFSSSIEPTKAGSGTLIVNSPVKGFVFINGHLITTTPAIIEDIAPGRHSVAFGRLGFNPVFQEVEVKSAEKTVVDFKTTPVANSKAFFHTLDTIDNQLVNKSSVPEGILEIARKVRVDNIIILRANANDTEVSWYNMKLNVWHKRVRRRNAVIGDLNKEVVKEVFNQKKVIDLATVREKDKKCFSDRDCGEGTCIAGRCTDDTPVYKKWWFWTAIGVGAAALGGGSYFLIKMKNRPEFRFSTP
ncbi:PEGA domain-containing protein [Myxococcota bacterium]|nr:PEGA domain-containing protein [Myxococcota bacterium]MBU1379625.1 PEGA domain-containing protein [Myxococcota bacterium]MBU1498018.1 PEGA domain-containing protein [Myxococcota bacterium]